ncbi:Protein of unknown function [Pyronema omphalodes CBS 100304]|uniref:Uncharacterized protein n=1 Tax=Pyronema omphalodes (strain CBS 100304) TaxID=1076935 RepID=U4LQL9_PYROM|nr:Protein of unknown function [Pyronema omphalodes CBS 100304]
MRLRSLIYVASEVCVVDSSI